MKKILFLIGSVSGVVLLISCDFFKGPTGPNNTAIDTTITYQANVKQIIDSRCVSCHLGQHLANGPTDLSNYLTVKTQLLKIQIVMNSGTMPKSGSTQAAEMRKGEKDTLINWADWGAREK